MRGKQVTFVRKIRRPSVQHRGPALRKYLKQSDFSPADEVTAKRAPVAPEMVQEARSDHPGHATITGLVYRSLMIRRFLDRSDITAPLRAC